jgi:DNA-directed RNA polymerase subunit RPC12/RpoP
MTSNPAKDPMSTLSPPISRRSPHVTCAGCGTRWRAENAPHGRNCPRCDFPLITRTWAPETIRARGRTIGAGR